MGDRALFAGEMALSTVLPDNVDKIMDPVFGAGMLSMAAYYLYQRLLARGEGQR